MITVDAGELFNVTSWACTAIAPKPPHPILSAATLTLQDGMLAVAGFDYEVGAAALIEVDGDMPAIAVPGQLLRNILDQLAGPVTLDVQSDGRLLNVAAGRARYAVRCMPISEYPTLPKLPPVIGSMTAEDFREVISRVALAATLDQSLPILTGLHVVAHDGIITATAIDRYRLHRVEWPWRGDNFEALLPAARVASLVKSLDGNVQLMLAEDSGVFGFADDHREATCRLLAGEYPNLAPIIRPIPDDRRAVVGIEELSHAIRAAAVMADMGEVRLRFADGVLTVTVPQTQSGDSDIELNADYTDDPVQVRMNAGYTISALGILPGTHVQVMLPKQGYGKVTLHGLDHAAAQPNSPITAIVMSVNEGPQ